MIMFNTETEKEYIPRFYGEDKSTIMLSDLFSHKQCIKYAKEHNFDVIYTETTACNSVEVIVDFIDNGFSHEFIKNKVLTDNGEFLYNRIQCKFSRNS